MLEDVNGHSAAIAGGRGRIAPILNITMGGLALVFAALFVLQYAVDLSAPWTRRTNLILTLIWAIFVIDFFVRLVLAPSKLHFLKTDWIMAIAMLLPALGFLRLFALARVIPIVHVGGLAAGGSRGTSALRQSIGAHQTVYVAMLTVFIVLLASAGMLSIEQTRADANIVTFGDATWWCTSTLTTIGSELYPVSWEGRTLAIFVMIYGLVFAGYITAVLAVSILGQPPTAASAPQSPTVTDPVLLDEIRALRQQLGAGGFITPASNGREQSNPTTAIESPPPGPSTPA